jgi:hypothetical protein
MAAGAVGASGTPELAELADELLAWRAPVVLGLPKTKEPFLECRGPVGGMVTRVVPPLCVTFDGSAILFTTLCDSRMLPCPVGEGNWESLKSVEADSRLLWRSSKLTDGRKS